MGLLLALIAGACGASNAERSAEVAAKYLPATLETSKPRGGEVRTAKVRIVIDQGVQATPRAREEITDQIDYASQILQPMLGVKLVIDSITDWTRTGEPNDALRELTASQKPDGVTWVIGYVTASDTASTVMTELGSADVLGHHVVVRAWAEKPESQLLAAVVPSLKPSERTELFAAHRRHKQTVVLLHMLATTLGAIAEADPTWIQYVSYAPKQNMFSNRNRELLQLAIDGRLAGETDQAIASKLIDSIEKNAWGGWVPTSHDEVVAALRRVVEAGRDSKTFAGIPPAAFEEFKRISELARQGKQADALVELDNLLIAYPGNASMHELKCEIMVGAPGIADKATRAACARVVELAPGDPTVHFVIGEALIRAHDFASARAELALAEPKIANLPTGSTEAWRRLIGLYTSIGSLTWTEEVIARSGLAKDPTAAAAAQTRARYGIPRGARFVTPEQEASLVTAIRGVLDLVYASKFAEAGRALAAADKKWPGAPGLTAARCDLAFRQGQIEVAQAACARALAADPEDSWALYLYGVLLLRDAGTTPAGIQKLKKAIEVDPDLAQAWRTLAKAYARGHDKAALDELGKAYTAKFGQSLPP
ncbi:MAG TPA: hypothetical protein VFK02_09290 [Kofleriaceae bacterium]|nr:hypothetical protein [Kofleriaceae bacterium]